MSALAFLGPLTKDIGVRLVVSYCPYTNIVPDEEPMSIKYVGKVDCNSHGEPTGVVRVCEVHVGLPSEYVDPLGPQRPSILKTFHVKVQGSKYTNDACIGPQSL